LLNINAVSYQTTMLHFTADSASPPSETARHIGFKIWNENLYVTSSDGVSTESTDTLIDIIGGTQYTRFRIEFDPGVSAKFYVDDVLKATHSTYIPGPGLLMLNMGIKTGAGVNRRIDIGRFFVEREY